MLFDTLCRLSETPGMFSPSVSQVVKDCFLFDFRGQSIPPKKTNQYRAFVEKYNAPEAFDLPFDALAVEDDISLVLVSKEGAGVWGEPMFLLETMFIPWDDTYLMRFGHVLVTPPPDITDESKYTCAFMGDSQAYLLQKNGKSFGIKKELKDTQTNQMDLTNLAINTIEKFLFVQSSDKFVVSSSPTSTDKGKKVRRAHQRPTYKLMDYVAITNKIYGGERPGIKTGGKNAPHPRRRHLRKLVAGEGKPWKKDKTIVVPSTWVGPTEKVVGNRRYRVLIDK